jgi:hypothetical protein
MAGVRRTSVVTPPYKGRPTHITQGYLVYKFYGEKNERYVHRDVMEEFLGRPLSKGEMVHHINENRFDNRIENLKIVTINQHMSLHNKERAKTRPRNKFGQFI